MIRYARRVDGNHARIKAAFEAGGALVLDLSRLGNGVPDLLVGWRGRWLLVEVKDGEKSPSERALTPAEERVKAMAEACGLPWYLVETEEGTKDLLQRTGWTKP